MGFRNLFLRIFDWLSGCCGSCPAVSMAVPAGVTGMRVVGLLMLSPAAIMEAQLVS